MNKKACCVVLNVNKRNRLKNRKHANYGKIRTNAGRNSIKASLLRGNICCKSMVGVR